jgi:hypothetical protein
VLLLLLHLLVLVLQDDGHLAVHQALGLEELCARAARRRGRKADLGK